MTTISEPGPPSLLERSPALSWLRHNLFNTWYNSLLTLLVLAGGYFALKTAFTWALNSADWAVIAANFRLFMVGQYPQGEIWRVWVSLLALALIVGVSLGIWGARMRAASLALLLAPLGLALLPAAAPASHWLLALFATGLVGWGLGRASPRRTRRPALIAWMIYLAFFIFMVRGLLPEGSLLAAVPSNLWGGLLLTFMLSAVGIVFSFPIGVLLALGRRSEMRLARYLCIGYIELVRGVPLITILFMAQLMLPLFLPSGLTIDRVIRAMVGIVLFSAAYLAENVRGGLQAIPPGQYDAAHALGLSGWQTTLYIILPQALRAVIPILVSQFIALFKDTTLVAIVGLLDLLGIAQTVLAQPDYIGRQLEVYLFVSLIFFIFSYMMSYLSQRLETALGVGLT